MSAEKYFIDAQQSFTKQQLQQAQQQLNLSFKKQSQNALILNNKAIVYFHQGKAEEALQNLTKAIQVSPLNYVALFNLSSLYQRASLFQQALQSIECALSALYTVLGRITKQRQYLQKSLDLCQNNITALLILVMVYVSDNDISAAIKQLNAFDIKQEKQLITKVNKNLKQIKQDDFDKMCQLLDLLEKTKIKQPRLKIKKSKFNKTGLQEQIRQGVKKFNQLFCTLNRYLKIQIKYEKFQVQKERSKVQYKDKFNPQSLTSVSLQRTAQSVRQ